MTYDREVVKLDPARFAALNRGYLPPRFTAEQSLFVGPFFVVDLAVRPGGTVRFTTDGSEPDPGSGLFREPVVITGDTTVKARAFWSDGTASLVESRTFRRAEPLPAAPSAPEERGLAYEYFEGTFEKLPEFGTLTSARTGTAARPDVGVAGRKAAFALRFTGFVRAPRTGVYVFSLRSDDGSKLSIGGREIVANDGVHGLTEERAELALEAGWHALEVLYFQGAGGLGLELGWSGPGLARTAVPASAFRH